ncbi:hypothetical protein ACE3MQ_20025 [Paenibacillus lentus]|uniref:hypothetical protein n=1 Tax=Paenibacillus lentus TaxID=1338368 RepID=UPI003657E1A7
MFDGETKIFSGLIANVQTKHHNGIYSIELEAISGTSRLDAQKRRRSFQNKNMTYGELVKSVLKTYAGYDVIQLIGENKLIGEPIIQYDETDWEFLKRMASHLQSVVFSDIYEAKPRMYIGVPNRNSIQLPNDLAYTASKDLLAYQEARSGSASVHHTDFFTYEIQSGIRYAIGDEVLFRDKPMVISEMKAAMSQGQLIYNYRLSRRDGIRQHRIHNPKLVGVSMNGKVLDVKGQQVKLHLEIDQEQSPASAFWFPFAPPTGSAMYSMPQRGTNASLYFPDDAGSKAKVIGCVRTNGEDCGKTGDPNNRYFGTEHGSELEITPTAINVVSGSKEPLMISFDDAAGVILTSHRKLTMNGGEDISLYTPKRVVFRTPNMILAKKLSKLSGFTVESEYHLLGSQVKLDGADRTSYPKYNDEIETYTPPKEETEEKKFSWGKLFKNVVAGLAVVAAVTAVAVLCVATLGAGAVVIGAVAAGAAIAGTAAVASMAVSDIIRGEVSDMKDYTQAAFRETLIGAVSGAVFGPFGATATIGGKMVLGATTNTFESIMRQGMENNGFSFGTLLLDAGIGGITGGLFDARVLKGIGNAGKKGFQKANELFQKAVGTSTAWLKQGVKSVEEGFKESLKDLAAVGSQFAQMFMVRNQPALANGVPMPNVNFFEKWMPEKLPQRTEVQINYDKAMKEIKEEAEKKIGGAADPDKIVVDEYGKLKKDKSIKGQAHHLNQDAAFRSVIPKNKGLAIKLEGNAFKDVGTPHFNAHKSLEEFWSQFRKGGTRYKEKPTCGEYTKALYQSLQDAGLSKENAFYAVREAIKQRRAFGLTADMPVPRIPGPMNSLKKYLFK